MRYRSEHKAEIHRQIVKEASRRVRAEGLHGAAVSTVMRDSGLTHGGFYKHFGSKDDLVVESLRDGFAEIASILARAAEQARSGQEWKAIVKTYLRPEICDYPERGCPLPALAFSKPVAFAYCTAKCPRPPLPSTATRSCGSGSAQRSPL